MEFDRRLVLIMAATGAMLVMAGCSSIAAAATPTPTSGETLGQICAADPSNALCAAVATDAPTAAPTPTADSLEGPVGSVYTDTDSSGDVMNVTLTGVTDPAKGADIYTTPDNGNRFVAAKFTLTGTSGTSSDDANSDAVVIGSDGQTYSPDFSNVRGCTNFNDGDFSVSPGHTSVGCVVFQVPNGVKVAQIQWGGLFGGTPATWDV